MSGYHWVSSLQVVAMDTTKCQPCNRHIQLQTMTCGLEWGLTCTYHCPTARLGVATVMCQPEASAYRTVQWQVTNKIPQNFRLYEIYGKLMKTRDSNPRSLEHTDRQYTGTVYWYWYPVVLVNGKKGKWLLILYSTGKRQLCLPLLPYTHARSESTNADRLNSNFLQLGRRSGGRPQRAVHPMRLPVNTVIHTTLVGLEPATFRSLVRRATSNATEPTDRRV